MTRRELLTALAATGATLPAFGQQVPRPAPEIEFVSHTGQQIKLSSFRGKVVAVEVLLTTCPGCQRSAGALSRLQKELGPRGLQVIGLAIDSNAGERLVDFTQRYATSFPVGVYPQEKAFGFLQHSIMSRVLMPQVAFVDRNGQIREQHGGDAAFFKEEEKSMRAVITKLLAERASGPAKGASRKKG